MKNEIKIDSGIVKMEVAHPQTETKHHVIFDLESLPDVERFGVWKVHPTGGSIHAARTENRKFSYMTLHRLLTGSRWVDFKDGDKFNFCASNMKAISKKPSTRVCGNPTKPHEYRILYDGVYADVHSKKGIFKGTIIVDHDDIDFLINFTWNIGKDGYARAKSRKGPKGKDYYLHRLVMSAKKGDEVDHINRVKSDCRKDNLRICSRSENQHNSGLQKNNKSGVRGVTYTNPSRGRQGCWEACIAVEWKRLKKSFPTFDQAVAQRKEWEKKYNPSGLNHASV